LRAASIYIVAAWIVVQVASLLFPAIDVPDSSLRFVWLTSAAIFPLVIIFAWMYDISLDGVSRTLPARPDDDFDPSLRRLDLVLLAVLLVVSISVALQFASRIELGFDDYTIAVLPLDDLSGNLDEQYFVSGMQASIISGLSRISRLRVTSKASTQQFRNASLPLAQIAAQLGVSRIVEGTVLRNNNVVSIAIRLMNARSGEQVWSARFEDQLENIMVLQARIAQEIADRVHVRMEPAELKQFDAAQAVNPEAYLAFLRGVFHVERFNPEDMTIAATHFQRAVDIDPEYALGYWGLSKLCAFQAQAGMLTPDEAREQCMPPVRKALELDPFLPEAYLGLAAISAWQSFDWEAAQRNFERAIALNPSYAEAHMFYSHFLGIIGELEKSTYHIETAVALDPLNPFLRGLYSIQLVMVNQYEDAITEAEAALGAAPGYAFGHTTLIVAHDALGNHDEAVEAFANKMRFVGGNPEAAQMLEAAYAQLGYEGAMLQMANALEQASVSDYIPSMRIATLYEQGGDYEKAMKWYESALDLRDPNVPYVGVNTKNPEMRRHPRFKELLLELGLDYWAENL
jgi:TolB-like protein/Tfp pilus assembly protein PilF